MSRARRHTAASNRFISVTEVGELLECQAKHAFGYTGALSGGKCLEPLVPHLNLRRGRAWGAGVAHWHEHGEFAPASLAMLAALDDDVQAMQQAGVWTEELAAEHYALYESLASILSDYAATAERLTFDSPERELRVDIGDTGFGFLGFLDGLHTDADGRVWLVEFKLRGELTPAEHVGLDRQVRWYGWACRELFDIEPAGLIYDERTTFVPGPVKMNADGETPTKRQAGCTADAYAAAWRAVGKEPDEATMAALGKRETHGRTHVVFTPRELDDAGRELVTATKLVRAFDERLLHPVRNTQKGRCARCKFREICPDPTGSIEILPALFALKPPKSGRAITGAHHEREVVA